MLGLEGGGMPGAEEGCLHVECDKGRLLALLATSILARFPTGEVLSRLWSPQKGGRETSLTHFQFQYEVVSKSHACRKLSAREWDADGVEGCFP